MNDEIKRILDAFEYYDDRYKRKELEAAVRLKKQITPYLLDILEKVAADPREYLYKDGYFAHVYAAELLGFFSEPRAHEVFIRFFSLPGELTYMLFGDRLPHSLPYLLYSTCDHSLEKIVAMAFDKSVNPFNRGAALESMNYAVVSNWYSREEAITVYRRLLAEEKKESDLMWVLIAAALKLCPEELEKEIREKFDKGLVDPEYISWVDVEEVLKDGLEEAYLYVSEDIDRKVSGDVHSYFNWDAFHWVDDWEDYEDSNPAGDEAPVKVVLKMPSGKSGKKRKKKKKKRA